MRYDTKTTEELIDLLEDRDGKIEELEQEVNETESLQEEVCALEDQIADFDTSLGDREEVSEKAYCAGYKAGESGKFSLIKAWLNHKIEARL